MSKSPFKRSSSSSSSSIMCTPLVVSCRLGPVVVLLLIVSIVGNQLSSRHNLAEARYLPTRSDDSGLEVLKEIIKNLLNEAAEQQETAASSRPFVRPTRFFSTLSRAGQQRQSYLLSKNNNNNNVNNNNNLNNDADQTEELLLKPASSPALQSSRSPAFIQRRVAELISGGGEPATTRSAAPAGLDRFLKFQEADG